jgi:hypothetical protein
MPKRTQPECDYNLEFQVGRKVYRIYGEYGYDPPNFTCREKREWADRTKAPEWIENEFTRSLSSDLIALKFDDDGNLLE